MEKIRHYGLEETIHEVVEKNIPFLGICLGLQLMFESSDEGPGVKGLGLLPGKILRIPKSGDLKIPHMGWNNIKVKEDSRLFKGLPENPYVYFVHSYYLQADDEDIVAATTEYGVKIHAAVEKDNIFACQFHPEKSSTCLLYTSIKTSFFHSWWSTGKKKTCWNREYHRYRRNCKSS